MAAHASARLPLALMGNPVLRRVAAASPAPGARGSLEEALRSTMRSQQFACGLAAPQVAISKQAVVVEYAPAALPCLVLHNPQLEHMGVDTILMQESCLSVPGLVGAVKRSARVAVTYEDAAGVRRRLVADGFVAGLLQHELDHLRGVLFIDRASSKQLAFEAEWWKVVVVCVLRIRRV